MKKVDLVTAMILNRISHADHVLAGIPSERQLAEDLGLSRTTVRGAVQRLVDKGALARRENGRLHVMAAKGQRQRTIGFVTPAVVSADFERWYEGVQGALEGHPATLRPLSYSHWADTQLTDALAGFDGLFFIPTAEKIPDWLIAKIQKSSCRGVVLDQDHSSEGLPSVTLFSPAAERKVFEHLVELGHRRIDCLNTQMEDSVIEGRIRAWREFIDEHHLGGQLRSLCTGRPVEAGYQVIRDVLREGRPLSSALFCTTSPAAIGAMRALHEAQLKIGQDISVCAVNSEGLGPYLIHSLTALEAPSRALYLRQACEWMLGDNDTWQGPLLIQPEDVPLFEGESTGLAPPSPVVRVGTPYGF